MEHIWGYFRRLDSLRDNILKAEADDGSDLVHIESLKQSYQAALLAEEIFYKQKARNKWLKEGDKNTKKIHQSLIQRRSKQKISSISYQGSVLHSKEDISKAAVEYFAKQLTSDHIEPNEQILDSIPHLVTDEDNKNLTTIPSIDELKEAVFSTPIESASGPDGFSASFYRCCWDIIKEDLLNAATDFMSGVHLPPAYSASLIVLVPKVENPNCFSLFRPISLCQVAYKILSKILASRLSKILPKLISQPQGGFVHGRNIHDLLQN